MNNLIAWMLAILAGFGIVLAMLILVVASWYVIPWVLDMAEKRRRGAVPSPKGPLYPPTNRQLRRARKEFSNGNSGKKS